MPITLIRSVNHLRLVRKTRRLVYPGDVFVTEGQKVTADSIIARTEIDNAAPLRIKVAAFFKIPNNKIGDVLSISVGDSVKQGDQIATQKAGLFSARQTLATPYTGVVEHISLARGEVMIRERLSADDSLVSINVAEKLQITPLFLKTFMQVFEGQDVSYNQVLASLDGMGAGAIRSPVRGKIERIDSRTGKVLIRRPYSPVNLYGYIGGTVIEVLGNYGAVIETPACYIDGVFGIGNETYGDLLVVANSPDEVITADMITENCTDKIIVGGAGITYDAMHKAVGIHVRGVIVGGIKNHDIVNLVEREISIGITGQEEKDITIIATEGFGHVAMLPETFKLLQSHEGKLTSINGTTQIRAGVIRPEIIIPLENAVIAEDSDEETLLEPKCGMLVRIISEPYYGKWGSIIKDGTESVFLPNGTKQNVVSVRLDDGLEITIGENNLLIYEV